MACVYFTASSLDGFVVDDADSLDWLTVARRRPRRPFGYEAFAKSVGALVMGSRTYEWLIENHPGDWMYEQPTWVVTIGRRSSSKAIRCRRSTVRSPSCIHGWSAAAGDKDVWVVGGGEMAAQFVAAGLVDEMIVSYAPCSLGEGSPVLPVRSEWVLAIFDGERRVRLCALAFGRYLSGRLTADRIAARTRAT